MGKMKLMALLTGVALFTGIGAVSASAEMKCGQGKCGSAMLEKAACKNCDNRPSNCQCDEKEKCTCKNTDKCDCKPAPKAEKCESGKCGKGKCGSE